MFFKNLMVIFRIFNSLRIEYKSICASPTSYFLVLLTLIIYIFEFTSLKSVIFDKVLKL